MTKPIGAPRLAVWLLALPLAVTTMLGATAADGPPYLLHEGTWVCASPETYDQALAEQAKTNGYKELMALEERLLAEKACMLVDDDDIEDMMAPFVEVVERQGDKIKVTFTVEFYKRVNSVQARFRRVKFSGWTAEDRLADYRPVEG
ncbi:MAG TPA: hypothetical protein VE597_00215 [Geminicoccaceae bacterium]|nr:hypothetical protein [Geminicoccaceae bacterium]